MPRPLPLRRELPADDGTVVLRAGVMSAGWLMAHIVRPTAKDTARAAAVSVVLGDRQPGGRHLRVVAAGAAAGDAVELPDAASDALAAVLEFLARGEAVSIVGVESEITTQQQRIC